MTSSSSASSGRVAFYASSLQAFTTSPSTFRVLHSISARQTSNPTVSTLPPPKNLYVLDSSFNPPTLAHLRIARSALLEDEYPEAREGTKRLLLLLATQNADKAPKPAAFEQRLVMMEIFAHELLASLGSQREPTSGARTGKQDAQKNAQGAEEGDIQGVDIALTTQPYFVQKAASISEHPFYPSSSTSQIHLTGFDTLIRIFDTKYYPPSHTLHLLQPFLKQHRFRVSYRADDSWGSREDQDEYLKTIGDGSREEQGGQKSWVTEKRIVLVEGRKDGEETVSSTKVREAVERNDRSILKQLVSDKVSEWILNQNLYQDEQRRRDEVSG